MIVEHPFGTVKRAFIITYFLAKGIVSVKPKTFLTFLAYNMKRVINILGAKEIIGGLTGKRLPINLSIFNFTILRCQYPTCY